MHQIDQLKSVSIDVEVDLLQIVFYLERLCFMTYGYRLISEKTKGRNKYEVNCTRDGTNI